jgi:hypothetical protein
MEASPWRAGWWKIATGGLCGQILLLHRVIYAKLRSLIPCHVDQVPAVSLEANLGEAYTGGRRRTCWGKVHTKAHT